ncbi:hypothetical protein L2E82_50480 [Cichorium intybus]|nr:hypothetical protein L2E82_50480 [Cichorium intybus]
MGSESMAEVTISKSSSSSGEKLFPPGFRFHPTDEELVLYYLKKKIRGQSLKLDIIGEIDVYKWEPEELPGEAKWNTGDRQWFFFTHRDRKYPNGGRSNRATARGYWKATGKDRVIKHNSRTVGLKKTLVYHQGRAPSGIRTDWVMHEYTMDEEELKRCKNVQEHYALCKIFKKSGPGPKNGEQYGAPFVEEEWSDNDNFLGVESLLMKNIDTLVNQPKLSSGTTVEPEIVPPLAIGSNHEPVVHPGSDVAQSTKEPSEITCVEEVPQPVVVNEDFLELDDLFGPQPAFQNSELPMLNDLQYVPFDEFHPYEFYTEFGPINPFKSQHSQPCNLDFGLEDSGIHLWTHNQNQATEDFTDTQRADVSISTPSGVNEKSGIPDSGVNQNQKFGEDDGTESWFSSALWAFVESVPTSPASASESTALMNNAFDRIPSFGRISDADGVVTVVTSRRVKRSLRSRGIVYFSVLGVLFAMLCVFLGTSIELLERWVLL